MSDMDYEALLRRATVKLDEMAARVDELEGAQHEPIAIIGAAVRAPKGVVDMRGYWDLLASAVDPIVEVPLDRWDADAIYDPDPDTPGKTYARWGGFLEEIDQFDPRFFGISPREAEGLDPQQRLLMETTWEALERSGHAGEGLAGSRTGVFHGMGLSEYLLLSVALDDLRVFDAYTGSGTSRAMAAGRVAYTFDLRGPAFSLDTACSSSLVAAHQACLSLRALECDMAVVGGVNAILVPGGHVGTAKAHMVSHRGRCHTFDARADGYVRSEGCGAVVLKRLPDAIRDGDHILATILGSAVNQDGRSNGLTAPSGLAQETVIRSALADSGVGPEVVSYVEAHGTGTSLGDPIEVRALTNVFGPSHVDGPLLVGAVKSNIGHTEAAAGVLGLLKVVLAIQNRTIPPNLHFETPNPHIDWQNCPIRVVDELTPWRGQGDRLVAGISSFGFSGTNAHMVVAEPPALPERPIVADRPYHLVTVSARGPRALEELARRWEHVLDDNDRIPFADVAFTANVGRAAHSQRLAIRAAGSSEAAAALSAWRAGENPQGVVQGPATSGEPPQVGFLFTGQGSQTVGMGREVYEADPRFREIVDRCAAVADEDLDPGLLEVMFGRTEEAGSLLGETRYTQPALYALEAGLLELWRSWGVEPGFVLGHSVGEYVAAYAAGVFDLEEGMRLVTARGRLMGELGGRGAMVSVLAEEGWVRDAMGDREGIWVSNVNGPTSVVVSGETEVVEGFARELTERGKKVKQLAVSHAFHSGLMDPVLSPFGEVAKGVTYRSPRMGIATNVSGELAGPETLNAEYWSKQIREAVQFHRGIETLSAEGVEVFVEIGPSPTLVGMGQLCVEGGVWVPSARPGRGEWEQLLESLGELWVRGVEVDLEGLDAPWPRRRVDLPTYPFQRQRFWVDLEASSRRSSARTSGTHEFLTERIETPFLEGSVFEAEVSAREPGYLTDHLIQGYPVFPAAGYLEMAMAAGADGSSPDSVVVRDVTLREALVLPSEGFARLQIHASERRNGKRAFRVMSREEGGRGNWREHVSGEIQYLSDSERRRRTAESAEEHATLASLLEGSLHASEVDGYYGRLAARGVPYGKRFRTIRDLAEAPGEAMGTVALLDTDAATASRYLIHPALLDGCLQLLGPAAPPGPNAYVPVSIGSIRILRPGQSIVRCSARVRSQDTERKVLVGDIVIVDLDGEVVGEISDIRLLLPDPSAIGRIARSAEGASSDWLYAVEWQPAEADGDRRTEPASWVLVGDESHGRTVSDALTGEGHAVGFVGVGDEGSISRDELSRAIAEAASGPGSFAGVVLLDPLQAGERSDDSQAGERSYGVGLLAAQTLREAAVSGAGLWLVTRGAMPVRASTDATRPLGGLLWGLGRTVAAEVPELRTVLIDLDPDADDVSELLLELTTHGSDDAVGWREGRRYVPRLLALGEASSGPNEGGVSLPGVDAGLFRADGAYLVTGGLSGLGLAVARWMAERGAGAVLLMGRSAPSTQAMSEVNAIEECGTRVIIAQGDVSVESDVRAALIALADLDLVLRGVFHSAGVLSDAVLDQQSLDHYRTVATPKVDGTAVLDRLTRDAPLDHFVLFSTGSALLGAPGQANYAAANAYMDALAHRRRGEGRPALSVNWGPWSDVGMAARVSERDRARWEGRGMRVVDPEGGLEALEHLMKSDPTQAAVLRVNWNALFPDSGGHRPGLVRELVTDDGKASAESPGRADVIEALLQVPESERLNFVAEHIGGSASKILRLGDDESLDHAGELTGQGMDSLMAVELRNELQADFNCSLPPTVAFEHPTILALATHVLTLIASAPSSTVPEVVEEGWEVGEV